MKKKLLLSSLLITLLLSSSLSAEENLEDDLSGFSMQEEETPAVESDDLDGFATDEFESSNEPIQEQKAVITKSPITLNGNFAFKTALGYRDHSVKAHKNDATGIEYSGFNQLQTALYLQADAKLSDEWKLRVSGDAFYDALYDIKTQNDYNQDTLDAYRTQLRFDDVYLQGRLTNNLDLKAGRQIVVWGKSDSIRITDVINPLDNRLPGMTDIEDLRLSTTMLKLDYYLGSWNISAMAIAENRIFIEAAPRSEFFPVDSVFPNAPDPFLALTQPDNSLENMQYALALNGVFSGWDLSFYGADVLDSKWHIEGTLPNATRAVSKIQMLGSAANIVFGSWLLKGEAAFVQGVKYNATKDAKNRADTLVGLDYMGIKDTVLSVELANRHIFAYESQMSGLNVGFVPDYTQEDEVQTALRATRSFSNDSLNATLLLSMFGHNWQYGGFFRASLEYDIIDAVVANFGIIDYLDTAKPEDKPFIHAISNNDKIFVDITYSF